MECGGGCHLRFRRHIVTVMTEWLVHRDQGNGGRTAPRDPRPASRPGRLSRPGAESGDSAPVGVVAG
jgi:hypothetical protein